MPSSISVCIAFLLWVGGVNRATVSSWPTPWRCLGYQHWFLFTWISKWVCVRQCTHLDCFSFFLFLFFFERTIMKEFKILMGRNETVDYWQAHTPIELNWKLFVNEIQLSDHDAKIMVWNPATILLHCFLCVADQIATCCLWNIACHLRSESRLCPTIWGSLL